MCKTVLEDVNLANISIKDDGCCVVLEFVDMKAGEACGILACHNTWLLNYHNAFQDRDDGFACYVGEVTVSEVSEEDIPSLLGRLAYGFTDANSKISIPNSRRCFWVHAEGGEVSLDLVCRLVDKKKLKQIP